MAFDSISTFFSILIIGLLLVIIPVERQYDMVDKLAYTQIQTITSKFQYEACKNGYIDRKMYDDFSRSLGATGRSYDIKFVHRQAKYYPLKPGDPQYTKEKPWIENFEEHHETEILKTIYDKKNPSNDIYKMHVNDDFKVIVKDRGLSQSTALKAMLNSSSKNTSYVFAEYGGGVQNEIK